MEHIVAAKNTVQKEKKIKIAYFGEFVEMMSGFRGW